METTKNTIYKKQYFVTLAATLCCALWGSATPFIKIGYELMLPEKQVSDTILFAGIRFFLAGLITVLIYSIARKKAVVPKRKNLGKIATVSLFQTIIQYIFFYIGLANTTGVKGTIISGSNTFFAILISCLIFRQEKLTVKKIIACFVGFLGIIAVNMNGLDLNMNFMGDGFVLFSTVAYAISSVLMKKFSSSEDPVAISGYQFILGGAVMIALGAMLGGQVSVTTPAAMGVLLYLACLSAVAYALWGVLLKHNPVSKITVHSFLIPVFGVVFSSLMLKEQSGVELQNLIFALVLVCAGVTMLNYTPSKKS